ncbi:hypothetical protein EMIHUDRAFT_452749 [Emiliania huxleyi CCMP1516]|uniref:Uncharacterized protein n=2 Tax=Emiliania huxleyi TaxID=2903 RepID=A0A0D3IFB5_EMIH1|nr:hypothetical protein EMIHUDRAFT_452749 [Emiliania huxleyi CCMP1516]EOD09950.1 hypothetical protein EMIHUDRAFT_452749 [Emiliania huxleyi CCMP1516]|eukprot:XP_005762379.1 hypothetical protein EMIHUDRAFT_452749 [Emiliania huxleyi CCMP1516]
MIEPGPPSPRSAPIGASVDPTEDSRVNVGALEAKWVGWSADLEETGRLFGGVADDVDETPDGLLSPFPSDEAGLGLGTPRRGSGIFRRHVRRRPLEWVVRCTPVYYGWVAAGLHVVAQVVAAPGQPYCVGAVIDSLVRDARPSLLRRDVLPLRRRVAARAPPPLDSDARSWRAALLWLGIALAVAAAALGALHFDAGAAEREDAVTDMGGVEASYSLVHSIVAAVVFHRLDLLTDIEDPVLETSSRTLGVAANPAASADPAASLNAGGCGGGTGPCGTNDAHVAARAAGALSLQALVALGCAVAAPLPLLVRRQELLLQVSLLSASTALLLMSHLRTNVAHQTASLLLGGAYALANSYSTTLWEYFFGAADAQRIKQTSLAITSATSGLAPETLEAIVRRAPTWEQLLARRQRATYFSVSSQLSRCLDCCGLGGSRGYRWQRPPLEVDADLPLEQVGA